MTIASVKLNGPTNLGLTIATWLTLACGKILDQRTALKPETCSNRSAGKLLSASLTFKAGLNTKTIKTLLITINKIENIQVANVVDIVSDLKITVLDQISVENALGYE